MMLSSSESFEGLNRRYISSMASFQPPCGGAVNAQTVLGPGDVSLPGGGPPDGGTHAPGVGAPLHTEGCGTSGGGQGQGPKPQGPQGGGGPQPKHPQGPGGPANPGGGPLGGGGGSSVAAAGLSSRRWLPLRPLRSRPFLLLDRLSSLRSLSCTESRSQLRPPRRAPRPRLRRPSRRSLRLSSR